MFIIVFEFYTIATNTLKTRHYKARRAERKIRLLRVW